MTLLDQVFLDGRHVTIVGYDKDHDGSQLVEVSWDNSFGEHHKLLVKPEQLTIK